MSSSLSDSPAAVTSAFACTLFDRGRLIAAGDLPAVVRAGHEHVVADPQSRPLLFEDATGRQLDVDLRAPLAQVLRHLPAPSTSGEPEPVEPAAEVAGRRGRPRLGVVAREVTLMPRHWAWLSEQPGGASVTLRRLVERARRDHGAADRQRGAREAANRFLTAAAGDLAGYEAATRALFAGDATGFDTATAGWPDALRSYARRLASPGLGPATD